MSQNKLDLTKIALISVKIGTHNLRMAYQVIKLQFWKTGVCFLSQHNHHHHHHHPNLFEQAWINPQQRVRPGCPVVVTDVLSMLGGLRGQFVPCQVKLGHASPTHPRSALACLGHSAPRSYALSLWLSSLCCTLHGLAISFCSHEAHPQCPWYPVCPGGNQSSHHPGVLHDRSIRSWHGHFFSSGSGSWRWLPRSQSHVASHSAHMWSRLCLLDVFWSFVVVGLV